MALPAQSLQTRLVGHWKGKCVYSAVCCAHFSYGSGSGADDLPRATEWCYLVGHWKGKSVYAYGASCHKLDAFGSGSGSGTNPYTDVFAANLVGHWKGKCVYAVAPCVEVPAAYGSQGSGSLGSLSGSEGSSGSSGLSSGSSSGISGSILSGSSVSGSALTGSVDSGSPGSIPAGSLVSGSIISGSGVSGSEISGSELPISSGSVSGSEGSVSGGSLAPGSAGSESGISGSFGSESGLSGSIFSGSGLFVSGADVQGSPGSTSGISGSAGSESGISGSLSGPTGSESGLYGSQISTSGVSGSGSGTSGSESGASGVAQGSAGASGLISGPESVSGASGAILEGSAGSSGYEGSGSSGSSGSSGLSGSSGGIKDTVCVVCGSCQRGPRQWELIAEGFTDGDVTGGQGSKLNGRWLLTYDPVLGCMWHTGDNEPLGFIECGGNQGRSWQLYQDGAFWALEAYQSTAYSLLPDAEFNCCGPNTFHLPGDGSFLNNTDCVRTPMVSITIRPVGDCSDICASSCCVNGLPATLFATVHGVGVSPLIYNPGSDQWVGRFTAVDGDCVSAVIEMRFFCLLGTFRMSLICNPDDPGAGGGQTTNFPNLAGGATGEFSCDPFIINGEAIVGDVGTAPNCVDGCSWVITVTE